MSFDVLFELGVEEIPHEVLTDTILQLKEKTLVNLNDTGVPFGKVFVYGTPRRLSVNITGVEEKIQDKVIEKKGPSVKAAYDSSGKPTRALEGFLSSNQASLNDIQKKEMGGAEYVFLKLKEGGQSTDVILPEVLKKTILSIAFPKTMRWGAGSTNFVRPIKWTASISQGKKLSFSIESIPSVNHSFGHHLLNEQSIQIEKPSDYQNLLRKNNVIVDQEERKSMILEMVDKAAKNLKAKPVLSDSLLDTVVNLTEFPQAAVGTFEEEYLKLPKEVLISEMVEHQKYIPLVNSSGDLLNHFIIICNVPANETIVRGNERVIRARFSDGQFFFDEDRKKPLEEHLLGLKNVLYARGLGSMYDKVERLQKITAVISEMIGYDDALALALRSAYLCKADLVSNMVCEFTELQGVIGYYYALNSMENINVAISIREHYWPKYSGDALPSLKEGILVSLADRFDNLFAMYSRANYVTGSKDPFALRRQTLGIIRILIEKKINLDIALLFSRIFPLYESFLSVSKDEFSGKIFEFITSRVKTVFKEYGFNYDEIEAGITNEVSDIYDTYLRIQTIHEAREAENFKNLAVAFKRVKNIIKNQEIVELQPSLLKMEAEKNLYSTYKENSNAFREALENHDYRLCVSILTSFRPAVDLFFQDVLVMDPDLGIRKNRVALLSHIDSLFALFIDFEKIVTE